MFEIRACIDKQILKLSQKENENNADIAYNLGLSYSDAQEKTVLL